MQNKINNLYKDIKEKITVSRLKDISIDIINSFKNKDHQYFIQFAKLIGIETFNNNIQRIFGRIIQIYHPDKFNSIINEIESLYKDNKYNELLGLKNIYLIDIKSIRKTIEYTYNDYDEESYAKEDFGYSEFDFDGEDIPDNEYDDLDEVSEQKEHGFVEAVNELFMGNLGLTLSPSDLEDLDGILDLSDYDINILDGIEHCVNITGLNLSGNNIIKIQRLSDLCKLQALFLSENYIEDIGCLAALTELRELDISFNNIEDISVLLELPELKYVNILNNPIADKSIIDILTKRGAMVIN